MKPCREAIPGWLFKENMLTRAGSLWVIELIPGPDQFWLHKMHNFNQEFNKQKPVLLV